MIKNTQQSAIQEGATATTADISTNEGRRRRGTGQGNNKVEEDYDQGMLPIFLTFGNLISGFIGLVSNS